MLNITTNLAFTTCNLILPGRDLFSLFVFFFNNTTTTEIYTLSLHDALPIFEISPAGELTNPAWNSMLVIMNEIPFGFIVRGMHHWAAHIMIAADFLHMCRVYFTGAYKKPRELNWLLGVVLMLVTIMFGYSGYLLPPNNLSEGAANIGINMTRASPLIGDQLATLLFGDISTLTGVYILRWYWIHVFILPLLGTGLMILHMGLVWLQGVAEPH